MTTGAAELQRDRGAEGQNYRTAELQNGRRAEGQKYRGQSCRASEVSNQRSEVKSERVGRPATGSLLWLLGDSCWLLDIESNSQHPTKEYPIAKRRIRRKRIGSPLSPGSHSLRSLRFRFLPLPRLSGQKLRITHKCPILTHWVACPSSGPPKRRLRRRKRSLRRRIPCWVLDSERTPNSQQEITRVQNRILRWL